ncbi:MAG: bacteriohopanetetrol glucosamine biosynthesis glycosyltransferase HpnI [Caulobacteraceae bacterium]
MALIHSIIALALAALAITGCGFQIIVLLAAERFFARPAKVPTGAPSINILKPLCGAPAGLEEALASFCDQAWGGPVQILFGIQDEADPAVSIVEELKRLRPDQDLAIVLAPRRPDENSQIGNPKIANLLAMAPHAKGEILVVSDADILAPAGYLAALLAELEAPDVGAASGFYFGAPRVETGGGIAARLAALEITTRFLPNAVFSAVSGLAQPCMGSAIALRRETLAAIGGFEALGGLLADDFELGAAVRRRGLRLAWPPRLLGHLCVETSLREVFGHELRWARTIRRIDPAGHSGSLISHPFALALLAAFFAGFSPWSLVLLAVALLLRWMAKWRMERIAGIAAGPAWLLPLGDVLSLMVFIASFAGGQVAWRGRRLSVDAEGRLSAPNSDASTSAQKGPI